MPNKKSIAEKIEDVFLTECPNCGSTWGIGSEEYDFQECDYCGYPDNKEDFGCDEDFEGDDFEDDYEG
jgi:hypothetical protein